MFFAYHIVPSGGHMRQALESGACTAPDLQVAKLHVQTVPAPSVAGKFGLEVILQIARVQKSGVVHIWGTHSPE